MCDDVMLRTRRALTLREHVQLEPKGRCKSQILRTPIATFLFSTSLNSVNAHSGSRLTIYRGSGEDERPFNSSAENQKEINVAWQWPCLSSECQKDANPIDFAQQYRHSSSHKTIFEQLQVLLAETCRFTESPKKRARDMLKRWEMVREDLGIFA